MTNEHKITIEICPEEPRATFCEVHPEVMQDVSDCNAGGDVEPACQYILDVYEPEFRIIARNEVTGEYENRPATDREMQRTCEAIYFESESDFTDRDTAALYLVWDAANMWEADSNE